MKAEFKLVLACLTCLGILIVMAWAVIFLGR